MALTENRESQKQRRLRVSTQRASVTRMPCFGIAFSKHAHQLARLLPGQNDFPSHIICDGDAATRDLDDRTASLYSA